MDDTVRKYWELTRAEIFTSTEVSLWNGGGGGGSGREDGGGYVG